MSFREICENCYNSLCYCIYLLISGILIILPAFDIKYGIEYKLEENCETQIDITISKYLIIKGIFSLLSSILLFLYLIVNKYRKTRMLIQISFYICNLFILIWLLLVFLWNQCLINEMSNYKFLYICISVTLGYVFVINFCYLKYKYDKLLDYNRKRPMFYEEMI